MSHRERVGFAASDNDVVEEVDVDGFGRIPEKSSHLQVRSAGRGVAARMIVRADNGNRGFANSGAEDFARMRERGGCRSRGYQRHSAEKAERTDFIRQGV